MPVEYGTYLNPQTGEIVSGLVDRAEGIVRLAKNALFDDEVRLTGWTRPLAGLRALPPVPAPLVFAACINYREHAAESALNVPTAPVLFQASPGALIGDGGILLVPRCDILPFGIEEPYIDPEPELVAVLGYGNRVVGFAAGNDVSERWGNKYIIDHKIAWTLPGALGSEHQITAFKNYPTFKPVGNLFRGDDLDAYNMHFTCEVNGEVVQSCFSGDMIFNIDEQIAALCTHLNLRELPPGTLIYTGTSSGIGFRLTAPETSRPSLKPGDTVTIRFPFGAVTNPVGGPA
jgi:2-keto-4-pentenoate hydratase/2-oxohepta-3-ene-1,7-dioic acid hydratase in catechol pathway